MLFSSQERLQIPILSVCDIIVLPGTEVLARHKFYTELPVFVLACCSSLCFLMAVNK